jgi:tetratricopeptide (TPR) repeat protein
MTVISRGTHTVQLARPCNGIRSTIQRRKMGIQVMQRLLLCLFVFTSIVAKRDGLVQAVNFFGLDSNVQEVPVTLEAKAAETTRPGDNSSTAVTAGADYSKEPFIVEQVRLRFRFEDDGTGRREQTVRVRVQSESGVQLWGQLKFPYNSASERYEIAYVRVIKQGGSVVTAGTDTVQELSEPIQQTAPVYTDLRTKHLTVPGLRPGDVLEYQTVAVIHTPLAPGQFWMQYDFQKNAIVLDDQLEIDLPADRAVKLKSKPGMEPKITQEGGRRIYRWSSSHLEREDESGTSDNQKKKKNKRADDEPPAVQLTSFASWEEVGKWYAGLERDRRVPSAPVRAKAKELTKGLSTDIAKVEALYDYTAENFRYVSLSLGMGRYKPHSADEVLHNQYGDCKDKHTLLASLLEAEGMHASSAMINYGRKLDPELPSPAQFNHIITMVPVGKEEIWMDTTTEVAPFRLLPYPLRKKQALVIPPDGLARLAETPADPPIPDTEKVQLNGKINDSGKLDAKITYEMRGDSELTMRKTFRSVASAKWQQVVETLSSKEGLGKEVSEIQVSDAGVTREPFTLSYHVSKADFLDPSKKELNMKLPLSVLGLALADPDDADSEPIKLGPPNTYNYQVRLELPAKYTVRPPLALSQKRDYASYQAVYKLEGNILTAERKLAVNVGELPSSRAQDYLAFRRDVLADLAQTISLETSVAGKPDSGADMKPDDLAKRGDDAIKAGNYSLGIELLKRAVEVDPKSKMGWNDLGLAYFASRQDDFAINSFQKQIEVNPYHEFAYNNLGRVYLRQRKYEEAIKWFNKQIEISPLDKYAHGNIGFAYLEEHKYQEALPELEKAASLTPDSAESQVRLGEAYLNLDQNEKATAAFDRAVKISATPGIWNNIAYVLTRKKVHLDIARRYAESAVTTTAAALRNMSLDQIQARDIGSTTSLGSFWDTLGWVEFADGNLDKAQTYILAAWQLNQRSEAADHLGQIYEKRGEKEQALHFYALAMNARRPDPGTRNRLTALAGAKDNIDSIIERSRQELTEQRTMKVPNMFTLEGRAEFLLLLTNGPSSRVSVDGVKFVSGDEKLWSLTDALHTAQYRQTLPDDTAVKLLRRAILSCSPTADCTLLLTLPEDVRSAD